MFAAWSVELYQWLVPLLLSTGVPKANGAEPNGVGPDERWLQSDPAGWGSDTHTSPAAVAIPTTTAKATHRDSRLAIESEKGGGHVQPFDRVERKAFWARGRRRQTPRALTGS